MKASAASVFVWASAVVVVAALVLGLFVLGSPADERARRADERRVADLRGIEAGTDLFWTRHAELPATLDALTAEPGVTIRTIDPLTGATYGYRALDSLRFEVCATFERASEELPTEPAQRLWVHGSGRQCFELEAEDVREEGRRH